MKNKKIIVSICIVLIFISILMCFSKKIDVTKYTISNKKIPEEIICTRYPTRLSAKTK